MGAIVNSKGEIESAGIEGRDDDSSLDYMRDAAALARDGVRAAATSMPQQRGARGENIATTLLASARHELRSPLQSIQGFAELLGSEAYGSLSEQQHAFVGHILQGSMELGSVLEACLEVAELQIARSPADLALTDLRAALTDALDHATESSSTALQTRYGAGIPNARVCVEQASLRRAFHALLTGMATGPSKVFRVDFVLEGTQVRLTLSAPKRSGAAPNISVDEFARRRRATRSLVWLRLASDLLLLQDASLLVTEQLDCVEVRFSLSSPH
ncbi:MAG: histidine kinase [Myxococcaceae bacterium]|nr:histidine kinase [Myxococcaceae bacterium]